jgi:hypothetical protein
MSQKDEASNTGPEFLNSLNPNDSHWVALYKLVAYVRATAHFALSVEPVD